MDDARLAEFRRVWEAKPALRLIYGDYYRRMAAHCVPGPTLEVGGGRGELRRVLPDVVATDLLEARGLDAVADAHALPFRDAAFANLAMVDVLHHLAWPRRFLGEACRVVRPGGRIVLLEPAITPVSGIFYRLFHAERVDMRSDPLGEAPLSAARDPFDANQAVATLLLTRHRDRLQRGFPSLRLVECRWISCLAYPLSGGFQPWSLLPERATPWLLRVEHRLEPVLGRLLAFRLLAVLERVREAQSEDA
jgi:SAM-dependent methyltransferase